MLFIIINLFIFPAFTHFCGDVVIFLVKSDTKNAARQSKMVTQVWMDLYRHTELSKISHSVEY